MAALVMFTGSVAGQDNNERTKPKPPVNTQSKTPVKIIQYIPGTWSVDQVYRGKKSISETDSIGADKTLEFNREGRYMSYSGTEMIDSGAYRLNEDHALLYLESDVEQKASQWKVWFSDSGTMSLEEKDGASKGEKIKYVYKRTSNTTTSNRQ
jgi:hypothetical protein